MVERAIGVDQPMQDAADRVVGTIRYTVDETVEGMTHARVVRSPYPHAVITGIDADEAREHAGVLAVVTGADIAEADGIASPYFGLARRDQPPLAIGKVRYAGEPVAVIVAETDRQAREAAELVWVDYDELAHVTDVDEAAADGAPQLHDEYPGNECGRWQLSRGDPDGAFASAHRIYEHRYTTPSASTVPLEPHVAIADWVEDRLEVWTATQWPSAVRRELARIFGLEEAAVRVRTRPLGGGYGAKGQVKIEPLTACAAHFAGRPVRLELDRDEVFLTVAKHAARMCYRTAVDTEGMILAREVDLRYDAGAYAITTPSGTGQALVRAPGPYRIPNIRVRSEGRYTNTVPTGSYRGALTTQVAFAYESHLDEIAADLGIDPVELRRRNLLVDGDVYATTEEMHDLHFLELLDDIVAGVEWAKASETPASGHARGKGFATILKTTPAPSRSEVVVELTADGAAVVYSSAVDMGQGAKGTLGQLAADVLGLRFEDVRVVDPDTDRTPFDAMTAGSRTTHASGLAIADAAAQLRDQLSELAAAQRGADPAAVTHEAGRVVIDGAPESARSYAEILQAAGHDAISATGVFQTEGGGLADPDDVRGVTTAHWHQGAVGVEVDVDLDTGRIELLRCHGASWAGRVISPARARQQNDGNMIFGIGAGLLEEHHVDGGQVVNTNLSDYMIPSILDVPVRLTSSAMEAVEPGAAEVHGVGEMTVPAMAPAIANAVAAATGARVRTLPLTPERVLRAMLEDVEE